MIYDIETVTYDIETLPGLGQTLTAPDTDTRNDPRLSHDDGDHERFAHYVDKNKIVESAVMGSPVTALCGKVWVPSRDPNRFPVCPDCKKVLDGMSGGGGGDKPGE